MQSPIVSKKIVIQGHVQGVGMRYYLMGNARGLGLSGWVRNCADGTVECLIQGGSDAAAQFMHAAKQGPSMARVENIRVIDVPHDDSITSFKVQQ